MPESMKCDLCAKRPAEHGYTIKSLPPTRGFVPVFLCWKCDVKIPKGLIEYVAHCIMRDPQGPREGAVNVAVMLMTGMPPLARTDDTFFSGWQGADGGRFGDSPAGQLTRAQYRATAEEAGVSTNGKVYFQQLAKYPGDPEAWISTRGEARALLEKRGWSCEELGVKPADPIGPPAPAVRLADDIRDELVESRLADVPARERTQRMIEDAREAVIETHGRPKDTGTGSVPVPRRTRRNPKRKNQRA